MTQHKTSAPTPRPSRPNKGRIIRPDFDQTPNWAEFYGALSESELSGRLLPWLSAREAAQWDTAGDSARHATICRLLDARRLDYSSGNHGATAGYDRRRVSVPRRADFPLSGALSRATLGALEAGISSSGGLDGC